MRPKKRRKKKHYSVMIVPVGTKGKVKQFSISGFGMKLTISLITILIAVLVCGIVYETTVSGKGFAASGSLQTKVNELEKKNVELLTLNDELNNKVTILSDTINQKVADEAATEQEEELKRKPSGYPLSSTATMTEANANEGAPAGSAEIPMVVFEAAAGTSIIASGDGTVTFVGDDDTDYGHMVKIDHGNGYVSIYRNAAEAKVKQGDEITRGTLIFEMGEGSTKFGYEVLFNDAYVAPLDLLEING